MLQAYASSGGQDTGKKAWSDLLGTKLNVATTMQAARKETKKKQSKEIDLLSCEPVTRLAAQLTTEGSVQVTPAMALLRWALEQGVVVIPKTVSETRMRENIGAFSFQLSSEQVDGLRDELQSAVRATNPNYSAKQSVETLTRLCWRSIHCDISTLHDCLWLREAQPLASKFAVSIVRLVLSYRLVAHTVRIRFWSRFLFVKKCRIM